MIQKYAKLVRDNIPQIIRDQGRVPTVRVLSECEYVCALEKKLSEEMQEYLQERTPEELCDILEVVEALAGARGFTTEQIYTLKEEKKLRNGAFEQRFFLEEICTSEKEG